MQLDWTTFLLEILNFLILIWLLSRFFYRPVMDIISRRREDIRGQLEEARQIRTEADTLKQKYETRLLEWEQEKSAARAKLYEAIETERRQLLQQLREELDTERQKQDVINQRRLETERQKNERQALEQGAAFSARLLTRLASRELEDAVAGLLLEDLEKLAPEQQQLLLSAYRDHNSAITVTSAYPLSDSRREQMEQSLAGLLGADMQCQYREDATLVAGLRITIGSRLLLASIGDELKFFIEGSHAGE
jgi:F-type H+-transporting ATPase subunit b